MTGKPTVEGLGIDVGAQRWQRSGEGDGTIEVAMVTGHDGTADWVLMRVGGDPAGRVLVYDRNEWECFLDGARNGEFDDALPGGADGALAGDAGDALAADTQDALADDAGG